MDFVLGELCPFSKSDLYYNGTEKSGACGLETSLVNKCSCPRIKYHTGDVSCQLLLLSYEVRPIITCLDSKIDSV